jgi:hypothetical protein
MKNKATENTEKMLDTDQPGVASLRSAATKKLKIGSCESGELFFAFAFLFAASVSCEGGEKRTTAKNKRPKVPF